MGATLSSSSSRSAATRLSADADADSTEVDDTGAEEVFATDRAASEAADDDRMLMSADTACPHGGGGKCRERNRADRAWLDALRQLHTCADADADAAGGIRDAAALVLAAAEAPPTTRTATVSAVARGDRCCSFSVRKRAAHTAAERRSMRISPLIPPVHARARSATSDSRCQSLMMGGDEEEMDECAI